MPKKVRRRGPVMSLNWSVAGIRMRTNLSGRDERIPRSLPPVLGDSSGVPGACLTAGPRLRRLLNHADAIPFEFHADLPGRRDGERGSPPQRHVEGPGRENQDRRVHLVGGLTARMPVVEPGDVPQYGRRAGYDGAGAVALREPDERSALLIELVRDPKLQPHVAAEYFV